MAVNHSGIMLCFPSLWADIPSFFHELGERAPLLDLTGDFITFANRRFHVEIYGKDPLLSHAFFRAGRGTLTDRDLSAIEQHQGVLFLLCKDQSFEAIADLAQLSTTILGLGVAAVKVESSGVAWSAENWFAMHTSVESPLDFLKPWVCYPILTEEGAYSCGMHNFGLPDISIECEDRELAIYNLTMALMILMQSPLSLKDRAVVSLRSSLKADASEPYQVVHTFYEGYRGGMPHFNTYGLLKMGRGNYNERLRGKDPVCQAFLTDLLSPDEERRVKAIKFISKIEEPNKEILRAVASLIEDPSEALRGAVLLELLSWKFEYLEAFIPLFKQSATYGSLSVATTAAGLLVSMGEAGVQALREALDIAQTSGAVGPLCKFPFDKILEVVLGEGRRGEA